MLTTTAAYGLPTTLTGMASIARSGVTLTKESLFCVYQSNRCEVDAARREGSKCNPGGSPECMQL